MGHGLPPPPGPHSHDPFIWVRDLVKFTKYACKKDTGLILICGLTAATFVGAAGMIVKKIAYDPNIIIPIPWWDPNRYENNFDKDTNKLLITSNDYMKQGFRNRYKYHKRPEDIE